MILIPRHSLLRPHGTGTLCDPDAPRPVSQDYQQCAHCQRAFVILDTTRKRAGWCGRCGQVTCPTRACNETCLPAEKRLDMIERAAGI